MRVNHAALHTLRTFGSRVVDFCFPPACPLCDSGDHDPLNKSLLCPHCVQKLTIRQPQCARCSAPVGPYVDASEDCVHCRGERLAFESAVSLGVYDQELRMACLRSKLAAGQPLVRGLVDCLWQRHQTQIAAWNPDLVLPVPHRWWERMTRLHLCPLSIAESLAARLHRPVRFDLLTKCKTTPKQALLSRTRRRENVKGAFRIAGGARFDGATILVVDDVMTTGATAHECSRVLKAAGAARVHVAIFARAVWR